MDQHDMDHHGMGVPGDYGPDDYGPDADHAFGVPGQEFGLDAGDFYDGDRYEAAHLDPADSDPADPDPRHADAYDEDAYDQDAYQELADADTTDLSFAMDYGAAHHFGDLPGGHLTGTAELPGGYDPHVPIGYEELWADQLGGDPAVLATGMGVPFGADPDLFPSAGEELPAGPGPAEDFRYPLGLDLPEPVDGYPWIDPDILGHDLPPPAGDIGGVSAGDIGGAPAPDELFEYAGEQPPDGGDAWAFLIDSPDPATSALARWWSTGLG